MNISKLLFSTLAIGIIATSFLFLGTAFAAEKPPTQNQLIQQEVNKIEGVKESRVFAYDDCVVIAIRTSGVYLKSSDEKLKEETTKMLNKEFPQYKNIKITMSMKIFKAIEQLNLLIDTGKVDPDDYFKRKKLPMPCPNEPAPHKPQDNQNTQQQT